MGVCEAFTEQSHNCQYYFWGSLLSDSGYLESVAGSGVAGLFQGLKLRGLGFEERKRHPAKATLVPGLVGSCRVQA